MINKRSQATWLVCLVVLQQLLVAAAAAEPLTTFQQPFTQSHSNAWKHNKLLDDAAVETSSSTPVAVAAATPITTPPISTSCTAAAFSKQSCLFTNVCLQPSSDGKAITAYLHGSQRPEHAVLLKQHLDAILQGMFKRIDCKVSPSDGGSSRSSSSSSSRSSSSSSRSRSSRKGDTVPAGSTTRMGISRGVTSHSVNTSEFDTEHSVTMLWRLSHKNQNSFGHALLNFAFPMFMVLQNHFGPDIPTHLQLLAAGSWHDVLHHVITGTITRDAQLLADKLAALKDSSSVGRSSAVLCFKQLLVGDGGYVRASRASLANSREPEADSYSALPSFFSSNNWWAFRQHSLQINEVTATPLSDSQALQPSHTWPLILLNDKRHGPHAEPDRRMILDIDGVAANISATYPAAEVMAVRFRDLDWPDQLRLLSRASVFMSTQGSSAFRLVFLPRGATCIMIGAPEKKNAYTEWKNFHELDRWFPLSYVQFERYEVPIENKHEYEVRVIPESWQPNWWFPAERKRWWLYNANVRVVMDRLKPTLDRVMARVP